MAPKGKEMVKSRVSSSPSMAQLRLRLLRIVDRHHRMKAAFSDLRSQIKTGLLEAEDVFASLSIPLMKLVGLKTTQMAEEGRFSTIIVDPRFQQKCGTSAPGSETSARSSLPPKTRDQISRSEEGERYNYSKVTETGKQLIQKRGIQLQQLVLMLRRIENQVNSHQDNILQLLDDQRVYLHRVFQQSIRHLSSIQEITQSDEAFLAVTVKLLRAIFQHVGSALSSVQNGVEDLMTELAENMCNPMTDYVKSLNAEMTAGALIRLVAMVEEMGGVLKERQTKLEEARRKVRVEEERKMEALSRLKDAEEKRKSMKEFVGFLLEAKKRSKVPCTPQQFMVKEADQAGDEKLSWNLLKEKNKVKAQEDLAGDEKSSWNLLKEKNKVKAHEDLAGDEKLLWDLLKEKTKAKAQASPFGTQELLHAEPKNKDRRHRGENKSSMRTEPNVSHRPVTRSSTKGFGPETPCPDPWPHLGSSPSVTTRGVVKKQELPLLSIKRGPPRK